MQNVISLFKTYVEKTHDHTADDCKVKDANETYQSTCNTLDAKVS